MIEGYGLTESCGGSMTCKRGDNTFGIVGI